MSLTCSHWWIKSSLVQPSVLHSPRSSDPEDLEGCERSALTSHLTPELHKDACLESQWRLLTLATQHGKKEEVEVSVALSWVPPSLVNTSQAVM